MPKKDKYAVALGRRGGTKRSPEKTAAAQANGRLGGRPATRPLAVRLKRIRADIDKGKPISPTNAALYFIDQLGSAQKALKHAYLKYADAAKDPANRDWWDAVIVTLEHGVE